MMNVLLVSITLPFIVGLVSFVIPKGNKVLPSSLAFLASVATLVLTITLFFKKPMFFSIHTIGCFWVDNLSAFIVLFISFFGLLTVIYSLGFMRDNHNLNKYYAYVLWTISASIGAALADHLIVFVAFWGMLGITLYLLIAMGTEGAPASAKKTFIIIGGSDALILLGIALLWKLSPVLEMSIMYVPLTSQLALFAFICFVLGAFAKAGAMPLHTWIPDSAQTAPVPVVAFLPASLDKLLGIYFLFRICVHLFKIEPNSGVSLFLMIVGAITVIAAVMMALVQHNFKKLLAYHAVSQVGYMVLGIGTATPIGIAGGLFHMVNHALYKSCLFFTGGNVEHTTGTDDLSRLGGLATVVPVTFVTFLIAAFSISGIPPLNGFVSKWMVYQGIIEAGKTGTRLWPLWLVAAMFGSALTLASFMKLVHAIFLGQSLRSGRQDKPIPLSMNIVPIILAVICVVFGVFAAQIPLKLFIEPSLSQTIVYTGIWNAPLATICIIVGLVIGFFVYILGSLRVRQARQFIGGEDLDIHSEMKPSGVEFYNTIQEIGILKFLYRRAQDKWFDVYEVGKHIVFGINAFFRYLHNGVLATYLVWVLLGMIVLFITLLQR